MTSLILRNARPLKQTGWDAFNEFENIVNTFFSNRYSYLNNDVIAQMPVEIIEKDNNIVLKAILPGLKKEDINVEVSEDRVSISGEYKTQKEEKDELIYKSEFFAGKFERIVSLPQKIDHQKAKAEYKDGILTLNLPKSEKEINKVIKLNL